MKLNVNRVIKKGMWVMLGKKVGIMADFDYTAKAGPLAQFHEVAEDGTTAGIEVVPMSELAQAKLSDIPKCRRPDDLAGRKLGYV